MLKKINHKNINYKTRRALFVGTIFFVSALSLAFIIINFQSNITFFYAPSEINKIPNNKNLVRVGGMIKEGSIKKIDALNTSFIITDYIAELKIFYHGILPDLFRENQGVVAKGLYNSTQNIFESNELLVKHDENYMPPEIARDLKMKIPNSK